MKTLRKLEENPSWKKTLHTLEENPAHTGRKPCTHWKKTLHTLEENPAHMCTGPG
jgi:hypothetical protein